MCSVANMPFGGMTDKEVGEFLTENRFIVYRKLEDGEWIGIFKLAYTWSLCCGIEELTSFKYRWCFENLAEAMFMYEQIESYDDEPDVDHRTSLVGHRYGSRGPRLMLHDKNGFPRW